MDAPDAVALVTRLVALTELESSIHRSVNIDIF